MKTGLIREPYLYGEYVMRNNRMAEVIRTDNLSGRWEIFTYIDNKMVPSLAFSDKPENCTKREAKAWAKRFVESDTVYPTIETEFAGLPPERRTPQ